jgi:selenocysteine lyase/cysteine desulfurase
LKEDLAVIAFNIRNVSPIDVATILDQRFGIAVRAGLHCAAVLHQQLGTSPDGCIRVSPGYFNEEVDIARLTDALKEIATSYV